MKIGRSCAGVSVRVGGVVFKFKLSDGVSEFDVVFAGYGWARTEVD